MKSIQNQALFGNQTFPFTHPKGTNSAGVAPETGTGTGSGPVPGTGSPGARAANSGNSQAQSTVVTPPGQVPGLQGSGAVKSASEGGTATGHSNVVPDTGATISPPNTPPPPPKIVTEQGLAQRPDVGPCLMAELQDTTQIVYVIPDDGTAKYEYCIQDFTDTADQSQWPHKFVLPRAYGRDVSGDGIIEYSVYLDGCWYFFRANGTLSPYEPGGQAFECGPGGTAFIITNIKKPYDATHPYPNPQCPYCPPS